MIKEIDLSNFVNVIGNKNNQKDVKLKVEGKKLKSGQNIVNVKSIIVSEELFDELGLEEKEVIVKSNSTKKLTRMDRMENSLSELKEIVLKGFKNVNKRLGTVEKRLETIEQLPTIQKELKTQKKLKSLKQKQ